MKSEGISKCDFNSIIYNIWYRVFSQCRVRFRFWSDWRQAALQQSNSCFKVFPSPLHCKAATMLPGKCERVNLKASQRFLNPKSRRGEKKTERESGGLLFLSSVFFLSSINWCGEGSFSPTHRRCQGGHTQTVHVNVHSLPYKPRTHKFAHSSACKLCPHHLSLCSVYFFSKESCFFSQRSFCLSFVSIINWCKVFWANGPTVTPFLKFYLHQCKTIWSYFYFFYLFLTNYSQRNIFFLPGFCCFASKPPPLNSSHPSPAASLSFPGCHAGDSRADHGAGEGTEGEHEHLCP